MNPPPVVPSARLLLFWDQRSRHAGVSPVQAQFGKLTANEGQVPDVDPIIRTGDGDKARAVGQKGHRFHTIAVRDIQRTQLLDRRWIIETNLRGTDLQG